jgi:hypothetical protein
VDWINGQVPMAKSFVANHLWQTSDLWQIICGKSFVAKSSVAKSPTAQL